MKKHFLIIVCLCLSIVVISGCTSQTATTKEKETVEGGEDSSDAFTLNDATSNKENKISFKEADILDFELEKRNDEYSDDSIEAVYIITNEGEKPVDRVVARYF